MKGLNVREKFEKWILANEVKFNETNFWKKSSNGDYGFGVIQLAWEAYQAGYNKGYSDNKCMCGN